MRFGRWELNSHIVSTLEGQCRAVLEMNLLAHLAGIGQQTGL